MAAPDTPFKFRQPVNFEETVISTPMPQASSTEDRKRDLWLDDSIVPTDIPAGSSGAAVGLERPCGFLRGGIDTLAMLKSRLAQAGLVHQPSQSQPQRRPDDGLQFDVSTNLNDISASMSGIGSSLDIIDFKDIMDVSCNESLSCFDIGPNMRPKKSDGGPSEGKMNATSTSRIPVPQASGRTMREDGGDGTNTMKSTEAIREPSEKNLEPIPELDSNKVTSDSGVTHLDDINRRIMSDLGSKDFGFGHNDFVELPVTTEILPTDLNMEGILTTRTMDQDDLERSLVREKAQRTLNGSYASNGVHQSVMEDNNRKDINFSLPDCPKFSLPGVSYSAMLNQGKEDSGFSVIVRPSQLDRDEMDAAYISLPIRPKDMSLSGIALTGEQGCDMFMVEHDSLFRELGPSDPSKRPRSDQTVTLGNGASSTTGLSDDITRLVNRNECDSFSGHPSTATTRPFSEGYSVHSESDIFSEPKSRPFSENKSKPVEALGRSDITADVSGIKWDELDAGADCADDSPSLNFEELREVLADIPVGTSHRDIIDKLITGAPKSRPCSQASSTSSQYDKNASVDLVKTDTHFNDLLSSIGLEKCYSACTLVGCEVYMTVEATCNCEIVEMDKLKVMAMISYAGNGGTTVLLMPLKVGDIRVVVQEIGRNGMRGKRHVIRLISEDPNIELLSSIKTDFGTLPDQCTEKRTVLLKNNNRSPVSILYSFKQDFGGAMCFELAECNGEPAGQVIEIMPGEVVRKDIVVNTPHMDTNSGPKMLTIQAELSFVLKTFERYRRVVSVARVALGVRVVRARLQIKRACAEQTYPPNEPRFVGVFNASDIDLLVRMKVEPEQEFRVSDKFKTLPPNSHSEIEVTYIPLQDYVPSTGTGVFYLQIMPFGQIYRVPLTRSGSLSQSMMQSSAGMPLNLNCTNRHLVWSSVPLNSHIEKSCCLRNSGQCREKLIFTIDDPSNSFFFVKDGEKTRQLKVMLDSMQKRELTVTLSPIVHGQLRATIVVTRVQKDNERKTIGLLGFGGRGHVRMDSVAMDLETDVRKLLLDSTTLSTTFCLHNIGDGDSYFYITQPCIEGRFLEVKPSLGKLSPGTRAQVTLQFTADASSIEELLRDNRYDAEIKVSNILITHGDHPTKLRLARLYKKYGKSCDDKEMAPIMKSVAELTGAFTEQVKWEQQVISDLKDPLGSICSLYKDGVRQWGIHVIISRHALEAALLDSTEQFTLLEDTVMIEESLNPTCVNIEASLQQSCNFSVESFIEPDKYSLAQMLGVTSLDRIAK